MAGFELISRRVFLKELGLGTVGLVVFGAAVVACGSDSSDGKDITWNRVQLERVSAYLLVRNGEIALIDTGWDDSTPAIAAGITAIGLGWTNVGHIIVTHSHPDHLGGIEPAMQAAPSAVAYAGEGDLSSVANFAPRPVTSVRDGDQVFGLDIIDTPGHTSGHICVLDNAGGLLVAGDALTGEGGAVAGPNSASTASMATARESVAKLAGFQFDTVVFGHGDPVEGGADAAVKELAATL